MSYDNDDNNWDNILYEELSSNRPIIYTGGNHAWVIDGYQDGAFHMNWGWDGDMDGYYKVSGIIEGDFMNSYRDGKTPNPCVECNRYFKFGAFYDKAMELGCDYIAMGHYAKIEYSEKYGQNVLRKSSSNNKDQTYFLYNIQNEVLQKMIFPLEDFKTKDEVRAIAEKYNLTVAKRKDSQEICFCPDGNYQEFLLQQFKNRNLTFIIFLFNFI